MLTIACMQISFSQNFKFGKVSVEELNETVYPLDSTADAAYLYKYRRTHTDVTNGEIRLITDIHVRIKLFNQDGFDWATEEVSLFGSTKSSSESASNFKAITYNLEGGKIVETKLDKKAVFTEEKSENWKVKTFTMPNLKEGSVVEWTYRIYSPFYSYIDDVVVQYEIPVKKYETKIELLEWFYFKKRQKGYYPFKIKETSKQNRDFDTNDKVIIVDEENIPALKKEPYVNDMSNYTAAIEFEVASLNAPRYGLFENYATSWEQIAKDIYKSPSFGGELKKTGHLKDDIAILKTELTATPAKIFGALQYVKSKIKWNGNTNEYPEKGLRTAYKEGSGNIGDINLTLVAVLRELGINANPVLVSTRSNGVPLYATTKGINYVIAAAETNQGTVLLDASEKYSVPNGLPLRAINWNGILIRNDGSIDYVNLGTSITAVKDVNLSYTITEDGLIEGMNRTKFENMDAMGYRNNKATKDEDDLISQIEQENNDIEILNFRVSNKDDITKSVVEMYKFEKEDGVEVIGNKMYLTPMLFIGYDENPFKLDVREYPIDFGTPWQRKSRVIIQIPEGYSIESIPENIAFGMRDNIGKFIFKIQATENKIDISSFVEVNEGIVPAHYYSELKELFNQIVLKQTEKVVLFKD